MSDVQIAVIDQQDTQIVLAVPGVQGATGSSIPSGGTTDQVLRKNSSTDYDANWAQVTSAMIANGTIVNDDINNSAAIAGTKISPDFGGQAVTTTGQVSAARVNVTNNTPPSNGIYLPSANNVAISTGGSGRLFVDASGNVGLGITPVANTLLGGARGSSLPGLIELAGNGNTVGSSGFAIGQDGSGVATLFQRANAAMYFATNGSERLRITSTGTVNIVGAGSAGSTQAVSFNGSAPVDSLVLTSGGLLGVGTNDPSNLLHVSGTSSTPATFERTGTTGTFVALKDSTSLVFIGNTNGVFSIQTPGSSYSDKLVVTSAGNVGIGTSSPTQALSIGGSGGTLSGTAAVTLFDNNSNGSRRWSISNGAGGNTVDLIGKLVFSYGNGSSTADPMAGIAAAVIDSSGRVGIGTTDPGSYGGNLAVIGSGNGIIAVGQATSYTTFQSNGQDFYLNAKGTGSTVFRRGSGDTESARIDSSGRLLVGTASSLLSYSKLQVQGGAGTDPGGHLCLANENAAPSNATNIGSIRFTNNAGGIGATVGCEADGAWTAGSNYRSRLVFSTTKDGGSSPLARLRISNTGAMGTSSSGDGIVYSVTAGAGTSTFFIAGNHSGTEGTEGSGTTSFYVWSNGNVQNTNNSYTAISDIKLKENVVNANSQWDDIKSLQVRNYNLKEGQTHRQIGLIAQEVEPISPGLVYESPDRDAEGNDLGTVTKSVNYSVLYMKAVKALQEAMKRIEVLEQRLTDAGIA